eukprot:TRINITY_DN1619_c0_g1_i1.p1 TRINITY_DN1619_c0_g1~~TRINITY_DN1619_c0_g1_i1.p1  ORF type:complete len:311 (-),score=37.64 TRINITY_DN1619_c0_g1_i1:275-1207(-)
MAHHLRDLLSKTTVDSLHTPSGEVIVIQTTESIVQGFEKLLNYRIQSAPVFDPHTNKYIGFLDIRDLISFCCFIHDSNESAENLIDIVHFGVRMFKHSVEGVTISYLSRRNPFQAVPQGTSLLEVVQVLAKGTRRVPVLNEKGEVVNIISQSSIIQFLQTHMQELVDEFSSEVGSLKEVGTSPVLTAKKDTRAIDVFRLMDLHHRSGVAVVDEHGVLLGNTSGHDLKLFIKNPSLSVLNLPIMQFLNQIRQLQIDIISPSISCGEHDTMGKVISKLAATRVHRLFIVDAEFKPVKVVSISDILKFIAHSS